MVNKRIGRRAELTYQANRDAGRHGWLRLTPAYSVRVVEDLIGRVGEGRVLDPFCGTGTTPLCATSLGRQAVAIDVNPFLVWFARAKVRRFSDRTLSSTQRKAEDIVRSLAEVTPSAAPNIHNIHRWWSEEVLDFLCRLHAALQPTQKTAVGTLLHVAFCRSMIACSGAAFDHPSMSFGDPGAVNAKGLGAQFLADVALVARTAQTQPSGRGDIRKGNARDLTALKSDVFDVVVTSPPYPNRMSYVRELRPYMYWSGHFAQARQAGELDWDAIGGTWGIATSRLKNYERTSGKQPHGLPRVMKRIKSAHEKNGPLLAAYLERYFEDIEAHLKSLRPHVRKGGEVHYIIGNAAFYGHLIRAEKHYAELLERSGFHNPEIEILRKRNSKKELFEFRVSATA